MKPTNIFATLILLGTVSCGGQGGPPMGGPVPVIVTKARLEAIEDSVSLVGTFNANETVEAQSEIDGRVAEIQFDEGQAVNSGDALITLDQKKLAASVAQAQANFKLAQANLKRSRSLLKNKTISTQEYDQAVSNFGASEAELELAQQRMEDSVMHAPFDGVMGARMVSPGQMITKGQTISTIVSLDPLKVEFNVPERFIGQLKHGLKIKTKVAAYPDESFEGEVFFVSPWIEELTRTALVKARVANPEHKLKPGMLVNVDLVLEVRENSIVIPQSAVMMNGENTSVFVANAERKAEMRPVKIGRQLRGEVEITSGIVANEIVVSEGVQKLRPGSELNFTLEGGETQGGKASS